MRWDKNWWVQFFPSFLYIFSQSPINQRCCQFFPISPLSPRLPSQRQCSLPDPFDTRVWNCARRQKSLPKDFKSSSIRDAPFQYPVNVCRVLRSLRLAVTSPRWVIFWTPRSSLPYRPCVVVLVRVGILRVRNRRTRESFGPCKDNWWLAIFSENEGCPQWQNMKGIAGWEDSHCALIVRTSSQGKRPIMIIWKLDRVPFYDRKMSRQPFGC